jgi:hypothetical protein
VKTTLSSWKEIADYLGKGVRTVQRWEKQFALPVRRPFPQSRTVFAIPSELDDWLKQHPSGSLPESAQSSDKTISSGEQHGILFAEVLAGINRLQSNRELLQANISRLRARLSVLKASHGTPRSNVGSLLNAGEHESQQPIQ